MHIGFIMDGNRRWATSHNMLKILGHSKGSDNVENVLKMCIAEGIEYVSMWVIAKRNLEERSKLELEHLYELIRDKVPKMLPKFQKNSIKFESVGNIDLLPKDIKKIINETALITKNNKKMTFILAIGYGGQDEIVRGIKKYISENIEQLKKSPEKLLEKLDENEFLGYLDTGKYPSPDLIVRTGGDIRTSGYFLYQSEYSEYYFTPTYWPEFDEVEFQKAIQSLKKSKRNFGK